MFRSMNKIRTCLKPNRIFSFRRCLFSEQENVENMEQNLGFDDNIASNPAYQFFDKTFSFVVDAPMFFKKTQTFNVGPEKVKLFKSFVPASGKLYVSMALPYKEPVETVESSNDYPKLIKVDSLKNITPEVTVENQEVEDSNLSSKDSYVYNLGNYCTVDFLDDKNITIRYIRKTKIQNIISFELNEQKPETSYNIVQEFINQSFTVDAPNETNLNNETDVDAYIFNDQIYSQPKPSEANTNGSVEATKEKITPMVDSNEAPKEQFANQTESKSKKELKQFRSVHKLFYPNNIQHLSENAIVPIINYHNLPGEQKMKIDYLREILKNDLKPEYTNLMIKMEEIDIRPFFYSLAWKLSEVQFLSKDIIRLLTSEKVEDLIDAALKLINRYKSFLNIMNKSAEEAKEIIKTKETKLYWDEVYNIIKKMAESEKESPLTKLKKLFYSKKAPEHVRELFNENFKRLSTLEKAQQEYAIQKHYLEWVASLPFGIKSPDNYDLDQAKAILDETHFGLVEVKKRILEFLAIGKLTGTLKGKILCLEGPPGVGKTSFAFSIAKALGRKVFRLSLGGENDVSVLKGSRKTYVASKPGKIILGLKECQTENCVIIIDEIDKIGSHSIFGDPQSTLLEILDPEQNSGFVDNYLDFPVDLSNIFFICTANSISKISEPLLDRMDVIHINSYTNLEKEAIFKNYLLPKSITDCGLESKKDSIVISEGVTRYLINKYCREAGIRSLQKYTNKLLEKLAYNILQSQENSTNETLNVSDIEKIVITSDNISKYIGQPVFDKKALYDDYVPGVVKGLAYNKVGGSVLFLEASIGSLQYNKKGLKFTGSLGEVMKESVKIAYSFARKFLSTQNNKFLEQYNVHIHMPEGATPKDGPSAGIALTSALISLALNRPLKHNVAMTGEISLKGKVLKVGGLKEKILAAKREGIFKVLIPEENMEDIQFLEDEIKEDMEIVYVENYTQVYQQIFPEKP